MTVQQLEKMKSILPHEYVIFDVIERTTSSDVQLRSSEWAIITQIDGEKTFKSICENLSLSENEGAELFFHLHEMGLIEVKDIREPINEYAREDFFSMLETSLTKVIGPVASYIIDDVLWELNEKRDRFLKEKVHLLIESISQEILDESKRVQFQQDMLDKVKKL